MPQNADHITCMSFKTDIVKHIWPLLIGKSQIVYFHQVCAIMRALFSLIMLCITLRVCCPQAVRNAYFIRQ